MSVHLPEPAGLTAVVTGGASGIGLATARLLTARGARVACLDLKPDDVPEPLTGIHADVADGASVRSAVEEASRRLGGIDHPGQQRRDRRPGHHRGQPRRRVARRLRRQRLRHRAGDPGRAAPSAALEQRGHRQHLLHRRDRRTARPGPVLRDQGLRPLPHRATAADLGQAGIRVNCVNPGTAENPWIGRLLDRAPDPEAERAALNARQPMDRLVTAEEVAAAIVYLASPLSGSTTGTDLAVDGGMHGLRIRPRG